MARDLAPNAAFPVDFSGQSRESASKIRKDTEMFHPRQKKLMLILAAFPVMTLYVGLILWLADKLPDNRLVHLGFFIAAGIIWALPLKPLFGWVNSPPKSR